MQKFKVNGQSVQKMESTGIQTNGQTDGWMKAITLSSALMQSVKMIKNKTRMLAMMV